MITIAFTELVVGVIAFCFGLFAGIAVAWEIDKNKQNDNE